MSSSSIPDSKTAAKSAGESSPMQVKMTSPIFASNSSASSPLARSRRSSCGSYSLISKVLSIQHSMNASGTLSVGSVAVTNVMSASRSPSTASGLVSTSGSEEALCSSCASGTGVGVASSVLLPLQAITREARIHIAIANFAESKRCMVQLYLQAWKGMLREC